MLLPIRNDRQIDDYISPLHFPDSEVNFYFTQNANPSARVESFITCCQYYGHPVDDRKTIKSIERSKKWLSDMTQLAPVFNVLSHTQAHGYVVIRKKEQQ